MEFKKLANNTINFGINRIIETAGIAFVIIGLLLLVSLATFSPDDPNFIFPDNTEIKNLLGFNGSYTADLFFQTFGLISLLIPFTLIFSGINIVLNKKIFLIFESIFYSVLYSSFGSLFFSFFYPTAFNLYINGNGGFIGKYLETTFLTSLININSQISYYFLILIILVLFLISIHFKIIYFYKLIKKLFKLIFIKNEKSYTNENEIISEFIPQEEITNLIQEDLPFIKSENKSPSKKIRFKLPTIDLLKIPTQKDRGKLKDEDYIDSEFLEKILLDFGVSGDIKKVSHGPVVTLNEFEPAAGVKVSKIINLSDDIARNTSSESARIATIPGRSTIGIELPNSSRENVYLSEILSNSDFNKKDIRLPIALGKNISGVPIVGDLASMPHLLIAGTTGSGKSVCINTIILSLLYRHTPDKCKFILIDPKMLELSTYEGIPHLLCPVITEAKKAASVLGWVVKEMENRYRLMTKEGVRNIDGYNAKHTLAMPYIVVVVDEMSDLMLVAGKEIENYIQKLSQMARAAGIHIIMATQRPSVDVITGTIKANFPTRISFQVTSKIDSRTILGEQGAEQLLGKGDMLYMSSANRIVRIHAPFVSETEIEKVNNYLRSQAEPDYIDEILNFADEKELSGETSSSGDKDELYQAALDIIKSEGKASTSFLQRKLQIGYNRAARIIDMMEADGVVSKANHVGKRDVL
ncbi:cell division protein [Candidatus Pelagibacter ubique HTCC1002]|uniref:DNA translocase FtsK n=1 Tax=Pelagibacter ubique (strain HTCC1002) TaxID=314261 RepID=Q1V182_PELU1|nr:DNA translocase FtsK [Candidatus Pelagibacter ubique]EAS84996.1 cell division protein [Candidatus Pelagibacter ubique HTCC1002]